MNISKLEFYRRNKKLTQKELATKAGISVMGYQGILKVENPTVKTLEAISRVLEVPMSTWWEDTEEYPIIGEPKAEYERMELLKENRKLKDQVERDQKTIEHLNMLIDRKSKMAG